MNKIFKKLISWMLAVVLVVSCVPVPAWAAAGEHLDKTYVTEINDGYVSISVSNQNGGFLIDTLLGNQLKDSDDNKNLLFPSEGYDTSFTSIRVQRTDGSTEEYVFGRKYGFMGLASTDVSVEATGSSIRATWGVKDLTVVQVLTLVDETNSQHGLVSIDYEVTTSAEDVENVQVRILLDTALGDQDFGFYELYDGSGSYGLVRKECVVENAYENMLRSVTGEGTSAVNAYTVNAIVEGNEIKPYQVAFGHWANLATTVFDFILQDFNVAQVAVGNVAYMNVMAELYIFCQRAVACDFEIIRMAADSENIHNGFLLVRLARFLWMRFFSAAYYWKHIYASCQFYITPIFGASQ